MLSLIRVQRDIFTIKTHVLTKIMLYYVNYVYSIREIIKRILC